MVCIKNIIYFGLLITGLKSNNHFVFPNFPSTFLAYHFWRGSVICFAFVSPCSLSLPAPSLCPLFSRRPFTLLIKVSNDMNETTMYNTTLDRQIVYSSIEKGAPSWICLMSWSLPVFSLSLSVASSLPPCVRMRYVPFLVRSHFNRSSSSSSKRTKKQNQNGLPTIYLTFFSAHGSFVSHTESDPYALLYAEKPIFRGGDRCWKYCINMIYTLVEMHPVHRMVFHRFCWLLWPPLRFPAPSIRLLCAP